MINVTLESSIHDGPAKDREEEDIMQHLDYRMLDSIYKDYELFGRNGGTTNKGLDLTTFVAIMRSKDIPCKDEAMLVRNLVDLFRQIDVNNDQTLEWVEFTQYIIDLGLVKKENTVIDAIKDYTLNKSIKDVKHDTEVQDMFYLKKLNHLIVMEKDAKRFKVYNTITGKFILSVPEKNTGVVGGSFICADYIEN